MKGPNPMKNPASEKIGGFDRWDVEEALRTLTRAEGIKRDEKMMKAVKELAKERLSEIAGFVSDKD